MSNAFARTDHSVLGRWWWTVDRWTLLAFAVLIGLGALLISAAGPPVAERINRPAFYFIQHHVMMLAPTLLLMVGVSVLSPRGVRRLALALFVASLMLTVATLFFGQEIKGATRWIMLGPLSLQPSEFLKPSFAVVAAWLFARRHAARAAGRMFPGYTLAGLILIVVTGVLLLQPDFGMAFVCIAVWITECFLAGLPIVFVAGSAVAAVCGLVGAYFVSPHFASRIRRFLDPSSGDAFQVNASIDAFVHGGLTGTGPGQGTVKLRIPDVHADFIFAVAGEELGLAATLFIVAVFGFIVLRGFARALKDTDLFVVLAVGGLFTQFGLQALIHMGSSLHLLPAKGMTLPFISYGGSSMLALGIGTGMALALTRTRFPGSERQ